MAAAGDAYASQLRLIRLSSSEACHCWLHRDALPPSPAQPERGASPSLTITAAAGEAAEGAERVGSAQVYSLPRHGAQVELHMPAGFESEGRVGLGATLWPPALALSIWLADAAETGQLRLEGQRVLELGAGLGLPGLLTCAALPTPPSPIPPALPALPAPPGTSHWR